MPRAFSIAIQSETVARRSPFPCTAPASVITRACSARASVRVDLPASGWLMTANVRRGRWSDTRSNLPVGRRGGRRRVGAEDPDRQRGRRLDAEVPDDLAHPVRVEGEQARGPGDVRGEAEIEVVAPRHDPDVE